MCCDFYWSFSSQSLFIRVCVWRGRFKIQREVHVFWQWQWAACHCLEEYGHHCRTKGRCSGPFALRLLRQDFDHRCEERRFWSIDCEGFWSFDCTHTVGGLIRCKHVCWWFVDHIDNDWRQWQEQRQEVLAIEILLISATSTLKTLVFLLCLGNILLLERRWTRTVAFPGFPAFEPCMQAKGRSHYVWQCNHCVWKSKEVGCCNCFASGPMSESGTNQYC